MSDSFGNWDEMREREEWLTANEAEQLFDGAVPVGRADLVPIADSLASLAQAYERSHHSIDVRVLAAAAATETRLVLSDKGDPAATSASNANRPAPQVSGLPKRRLPVLSAIAAFVATTAGKVTLAAALTGAAATGGLAASDNLPLLHGGSGPSVVTVVDDEEIADEVDECGGLEDEAEEACEAAADAAEEAAEADDDADEGDECGGLEDEAEEACEAAADEADEAAEADDDADDADEADETDDADDADEADDADDADDAAEADDADDADEADDAAEADDDADEADEAAEAEADDADEADDGEGDAD